MTETAVAPEPAAPAATAPVAPATPAPTPAPAAPAEPNYALVAPQGSQFDPARIESAVAVYKAAGVPPAAAQALLNREAQLQAAWDESNKTVLSEQSKAWRKANESDPEYGGQKLAEADAGVNAVLTRFATPEFTQGLRESGLIHAPGLHKMLVNISRALGEKPSVQPTAPAQSEEKTIFDSPDWQAFLASRKK